MQVLEIYSHFAVVSWMWTKKDFRIYGVLGYIFKEMGIFDVKNIL